MGHVYGLSLEIGYKRFSHSWWELQAIPNCEESWEPHTVWLCELEEEDMGFGEYIAISAQLDFSSGKAEGLH